MKFTTSRPHLLCRRANRWLLRASAAVVLATSASQAAVTITISEVGGNLVFTSSGTLELPNLTPVLTGNYNDDFVNLGLDGYYAIQPNGTRSAFMDFYNLPVTASGDLVSSNYTNGTLSVVGDLLINLGSGDVVHVGVPAGFVSGSSYLGTSTVIGANFATYGIADGQSTTLSFAVSGGTETITFTAIPEPSGVLLSMLAGSVMLVRRKRRV